MVVSVESLLGHSNSFCVSDELGAHPLRNHRHLSFCVCLAPPTPLTQGIKVHLLLQKLLFTLRASHDEKGSFARGHCANLSRIARQICVKLLVFASCTTRRCAKVVVHLLQIRTSISDNLGVPGLLFHCPTSEMRGVNRKSANCKTRGPRTTEESKSPGV